MPNLPRNIGCATEGCDRATYCKGLCQRHYYKPRFTPNRVSCKRTVEENLSACSQRDYATGCLLWTGSVNAAGYGRYGAKKTAHRVSYATYNGPIVDGLLVCHRCDTPRCIEPTHLFLGTSAENTADCMIKGRHFVGKLTHNQVRAIRSDPRPRAQVAAEYGVSTTSIRRLCNGKSWRFVA